MLIVHNLHQPDVLEDYLLGLGARHGHYGVQTMHYPLFIENLLHVLAEFSADHWNEQLKLAWLNALEFITAVMIKAQQPVENNAPLAFESVQPQQLSGLKHVIVDQMVTPIMTIERDFTISYVNQSACMMLAEHEDILREIFPDFSIDTVIGSHIDRYLSHLESQRRLLTDPANSPFHTAIKVGSLSAELYATAIFNADADYIGVAIEWGDIEHKSSDVISEKQSHRAMEAALATTNSMDKLVMTTLKNAGTVSQA